MLSRALSLAAVTLLIGCIATFAGRAQAQNLDAGKSPSQIFAGTCNACHKSPRGLLKTVSPGSLPGFLREHYTTSSDMASLLSTFLISNGAADAQRQAKQGADMKPSGGTEQVDRQGRRLRPGPSQEAARPDGDGPARGEAGPQGRNAKRLSRPGEAPEAGKPSADGQPPAQAAIDRGPDGRKLTAKERLRKRGKPGGEESPKADAAKEEPPKIEAAARRQRQGRRSEGREWQTRGNQAGRRRQVRGCRKRGARRQTAAPRHPRSGPIRDRSSRPRRRQIQRRRRPQPLRTLRPNRPSLGRRHPRRCPRPPRCRQPSRLPHPLRHPRPPSWDRPHRRSRGSVGTKRSRPARGRRAAPPVTDCEVRRALAGIQSPA